MLTGSAPARARLRRAGPAKGREGAGWTTRKQAQSQSGNSRKQAGAAKPKGDFRPGRAHRAEVLASTANAARRFRLWSASAYALQR